MNRKSVVLAVLLSAAVGGLTTACSGSTPTAAPSTGRVTVTASAATPTTASQPTTPATTASAISQSAPSATATAAAPVLGTVWAPGVQGYGLARPSGLDNHGDPTGIVDHLRWSSWGGATARGTGTAEYVAPNQSVAQGTETQATVVAFDLGTCHGKPAYRALEWYFPAKGQHFDPTRYFDPCTGQDHGM
ncbi:hypothetical protein [Streptacidiphilus rugosus]|uniref:hypothetical protein n=1 Tax=Streptacidiphilus rugosus TaxID=405783 RepID=UPI00068D3745|nr:hypothetical protein [Streptacidiphilus rugosus]